MNFPLRSEVAGRVKVDSGHMTISGGGQGRSNSLLNEYASVLGNSLLRNRARSAEHRARLESEIASRVKSEFIANVSHELRTPLNTVIGFSKILSEHQTRKLKESEIIEFATMINSAATHLLAVINDILDISKLQSGKYRLDTREVDVEEVLQGCISSVRRLAVEAGIKVTLDVDRELPNVGGDPAKLRQALGNLIGNAVKFTQQGGQVDIVATAPDARTIAIRIRDTGVGMTEEEVKLALSPFGQVDGGKSRWREGTGLGLPIARALIELHGGTLSITSAKGKGTEVLVTLPPYHLIPIGEGRDALFGSGT